MTPGAGRRSARAATLVGLAVSFVVAVDLVRSLRPLPLTDPDPLWALPRLLLGLFVVAASASAGGLVCALCLLWFRHSLSDLDPAPLPFERAGLLALAAAALVAGTFLRFVDLERLPPSLWIDDVSLIAPALALQGAPADFADTIRPAPFGVAKPYGSVGVLYLELYRGALSVFGVNVFGVRFLSAAAGALSLLTALLLARELLPPGGGPLAALVLAGMRWSLIVSRWGWNMIALAPVVDLATLLLLGARRRRSLAAALAAGAVAGLGAHIYLSAWPAAVGLAAFALWQRRDAERLVGRLGLAGIFLTGFLLAAAPLFLFRDGRRAPYFARTRDHNVVLEIRRQRSPMPALAAAADALASPWFLSDPAPRNDLPGRRRLGWILGIPIAFCLARCLLRPREDLSALLFAHGAAALATVVAGGQADNPSGSRFAYLTTVTAVAAAAGMLLLIGSVSGRGRRPAALLAVGLLAVQGTLGARDALLDWPERRETFEGFHGQDTLIGRAAARWEEYGEVSVEPDLGHSDVLISAVFRYRLASLPGPSAAGHATRRRFRVVAAQTWPARGERQVERVRDGWGHEWAIVLGRAEARS
ncbi:MAG: glycosyltransferase family 39 protein [Thermoanaerobaculia bacterium]